MSVDAKGLVVDAVCRRDVGPVSFVAEPGEFVVVSGPRGSGKSTLIGCIAGFDRPTEGTVTLDGVNLHTIPTHPDPERPWLGRPIESRVGWLGAVIPSPSRSRRSIPSLVVGDEPDTPFFEPGPVDQRLVPLLATIRILCDQGAVVVVATHHRALIGAADLRVKL